MKHLLTASPVASLFGALVVAGVLTLAGCSAATLSGPDLAPAAETTVQDEPASYGPGASHNAEDAAKNDPTTTTTSTSNGGGNSNGGAPHNVEG